MNNRPVEQALNILLPTHANDLPPELVSLALSLVAQSRSFSTSLKPEEEIARPHACAEIACKRCARGAALHVPHPIDLYTKQMLENQTRSSPQATPVTGQSTLSSTSLQKAIRLPRPVFNLKHDINQTIS